MLAKRFFFPVNIVLNAASRIVISTAEPQSGAAKYVAQLAIALRQRGMPVALFCPANFDYADQVREAGIEIVPAPERDVSEAVWCSRLTRNLGFFVRALGSQHRSLRRGDIVHFQFPVRTPLAAFFYASARIRGAAVVLTAHDPLPHRWRLARVLRRLECAMMGLEYRLCRAVIAHNCKGCEVLREGFGLSRERVFLVPHGPDTNAPAASPFPAMTEFRLLAFGSIRANKGLHLAIEAVQKLRCIRSFPVRLTIAGSLATMAENAYWQQCKRGIERDPAGFEILEGFVPDDQVAALMARHHAVILPYEEFYSESGVATLSLSHARPILATASGGLGELMETTGSGVPIQSPKSDAVAAAIAKAFALGARRLEEMGAAGKRYVESARSWERVAEMTAEVYRQLQDSMQMEPHILLQMPEPETSAAHDIFEPIQPLSEPGDVSLP